MAWPHKVHWMETSLIWRSTWVVWMKKIGTQKIWIPQVAHRKKRRVTTRTSDWSGDPRKRSNASWTKHPRNTCLTTCVSIRREVVCEAAAQMRVHACSKCKGAGCYIIVLAFQMKEQLLVNYDFNGKRCTKPIVEMHEAFPNLKMVDFCRNLVLTTKNQFRKQPPLHRQAVCFVVNLVPAPQQLT